FKIAFIGAGGIARHHVKMLKPLTDVEVCAAADVSERSLKRFAEDYPEIRRFEDFRAMLKEVDCDAVDVCTPNGVHAENAIAAFEAGRHVMVEKPMAMNASEAQKMLYAS